MIQIDLAPEVEARLRAEASARGEAAESYISGKLGSSNAQNGRRKTSAEIEAAVQNMLYRRSRHRLPAGERIVDLVREGRRN
jgi:hypothetical protein